MAQFAPVAPIQILEEMKKQNVLGSYHLLLAHHVLEFPDRFRELFSDRVGCTIIMDNSIVELGDAASDAKVLEAVQVIQEKASGRNWVTPVLTDVMGDGQATRDAATESYTWWRENAPEWPLMVVTQGNDWEDYCKTVDYFFSNPDTFPKIEYAGVPRVLVKELGTRQLAIQYLEAIAPNVNTHLLGFSDNVVDDVICANMISVEGIDSAVPVRYSYSVEGGLYTPTAEIPSRPQDWFEKGAFDDVSYRNLANIRKWVA